MKVNVGGAVVEGFRVIGREPLSLVGWALALVGYYIVQFVVGLVSGGVMGAGMLANMSKLEAGQINGGAIGGFFLMFLLIMVVAYIFFGVIGAAIYRAVLDPTGSRAWARMRLGGDELRLALMMFFITLIYLLWYVVTAVVVVMLFKMGGLGSLLGFLAIVFSALSFFSLFAFVGPMTLDKHRLSLASAVSAAASNFWRLVGMNLLLCLMVLVLYILLIILVLVFFGGSMAALSSKDPVQTQQAIIAMFSSPVMILSILIVGPLIGAVLQVLFISPAARAYADVAGPSTARQADAFS
jgi:hypothetical protein